MQMIAIEGMRGATLRMSKVSARKLATTRTLLQMSGTTGPIVRRVTGRRNRLLAYGLWQRDGGRCGRCLLEIDPTLHGYLPGALTIGHIVPIARGGTNDPSNLRPEHRRCNLEAGSREARAVASPVRP